MFSGIIETTGRIFDLQAASSGLRMTVDVSGLAGQPKLGESIAVNGVCLTAVECESGRCAFDVIAESLRRTNLGEARIGQRVNLERSVQAGARLDGHLVQGHVDAKAVVDGIASSPQDWIARFTLDEETAPLVVPKGAIAVNGVSLTIAEVEDQRFSVALIPTTLARTNLRDLRIGDRVNLETDVMARTVLHQLRILLSAGADDSLCQLLHRQGSP